MQYRPSTADFLKFPGSEPRISAKKARHYLYTISTGSGKKSFRVKIVPGAAATVSPTKRCATIQTSPRPSEDFVISATKTRCLAEPFASLCITLRQSTWPNNKDHNYDDNDSDNNYYDIFNVF